LIVQIVELATIKVIDRETPLYKFFMWFH